MKNEPGAAGRSGAPSFACILPVFNGERFLFEAVQSLLSQSEAFSEVVIRDDGSTDGSIEVLQSLASSPLTRISRDPGNSGSFGANVGRLIEMISGSPEYVLIAQQDDVWEPDFVSTISGVLGRDRRERPTLIFADVQLIDESGRRIGVSGNPLRRSRWDPEQASFSYFLDHCRYPVSAAVFRYDLLLSLADLSIEVGNAFDWVASLEASRRGTVEYVPRLLVRRRIHERSASASGYDPVAELAPYTRWLRRHGHGMYADLVAEREVAEESRHFRSPRAQRFIEMYAKIALHRSRAMPLVQALLAPWAGR